MIGLILVLSKKITQDILHVWHTKFAAQFMQSCKNMVNNYLQHPSALECNLVAEMVRTGKKLNKSS